VQGTGCGGGGGRFRLLRMGKERPTIVFVLGALGRPAGAGGWPNRCPISSGGLIFRPLLMAWAVRSRPLPYLPTGHRQQPVEVYKFYIVPKNAGQGEEGGGYHRCLCVARWGACGYRGGLPLFAATTGPSADFIGRKPALREPGQDGRPHGGGLFEAAGRGARRAPASYSRSQGDSGGPPTVV